MGVGLVRTCFIHLAFLYMPSCSQSKPAACGAAGNTRYLNYIKITNITTERTRDPNLIPLYAMGVG